MSESAEERRRRLAGLMGKLSGEAMNLDGAATANAYGDLLDMVESKIRAAESAARAEGIRIGQERMRDQCASSPMPDWMSTDNPAPDSFSHGLRQGWTLHADACRSMEIEDGKE